VWRARCIPGLTTSTRGIPEIGLEIDGSEMHSINFASKTALVGSNGARWRYFPNGDGEGIDVITVLFFFSRLKGRRRREKRGDVVR
jgi:hypothetical protein